MTYTFFGSDRIGNDEPTKTQDDIQSNNSLGYMTGNPFANAYSGEQDQIQFATQHPGMIPVGSKGSGVGGYRIQDENSLIIENDQGRNLSRLSLMQRQFATVPYIGRGSVDPMLESQMLQGDSLKDKKSATPSLDTFIILDGSAEQTQFTKDTEHQDGVYARFGNSSDLSIVHTGSTGYLQNYTGDLQIQNNSNGDDILFRCDDGSGGLTTYFYLNGGDTNTNFQLDTIHPDNVKAKFGTSADLQIYHDGSNSYINEVGTGDLIIKGGNDILFQDAVGNTLANMNQANSVELYYGNSKKFETTSTGVDVTGGLTTSASSSIAGINMTADIAMGDYDITGIDELKFTSGSKFGDQGSSNYIRLTYNATGGGGMHVVDSDGSSQGYIYGDGNTTSSFGLLDGGANWAVRCVEGEGVNLRYNNSKKFETTAGGVSITGTLDSTGTISVTGANNNIKVGTDTGKFMAGASNDLQIYHDGSNSYIVDAGTGDLLNYYSNDWKVIQYGSSEVSIWARTNEYVKLFYNAGNLFINVCLFIFLFSFILPITPLFPNSGLDPSWRLTMHYAFINDFQFGKDIYFTFGPLADFWFPSYFYSAGTYKIAIFLSSLLSFTIFFSLVLLSKNVNLLVKIIGFLAIMVGLKLGGNFLWYIIPILFVQIVFLENENRKLRLILSGLLLFFLSFSVLVSVSSPSS